EIIDVEHLAIEVQTAPQNEAIVSQAIAENLEQETGGSASLQDVEKEHIIKTLKMFNGNKSKAARVLEISRSTLREKLKQYGIA
ncbi:MAG: helix-turn-helix domain-containing protein, partial [bacterium]|nr:helix-turn-helix domain-containing protein [bacterium]